MDNHSNNIKPEEIFPETAEGIPSIREDLREIVEVYEPDNQTTHEGQVYLSDENLLISVENYHMDFNQGKEIATVRIETERIQTVIRTDEIFVSEYIINFYGWNDDETFQISP